MDQKALHKISYGLYVLGVKAEKYFGGCVIDAVAQVSGGEPPVIILGSMHNYTNQLLKEKGEFTLSVLPENIHPFVVANFGFQSARDVDKWAGVRHTVVDGLPVLDGATAYLRGRVTEARELATHTVFFCEVTGAWLGTGVRPLIYGDYQDTMKLEAARVFKAYKDSGALPASNLAEAIPAPAAAPGAPAAPAQVQWRCRICGHIYDGDVPFEELPADWLCPLCGVDKSFFDKVGE